MPPIVIEALEPGSLEKTTFDTLLSDPGTRCGVVLGRLAGASDVHVPLVRNGAVFARVEVPYEGHDVVRLNLEWTPGGDILVESPNKHVVLLPPEKHHGPAPPLHPVTGDQLDLCFLIDGTTRCVTSDPDTPTDTTVRLLLDTPDQWKAHVEDLTAFAEQLQQEYPLLHSGVVAFGDQPVHELVADDLTARYALYPQQASDRNFRAQSMAELDQLLASTPSTRGGDYVDALADGLHACWSLAWRPTARKILVVTGDSPGFDLDAPPPSGANYLVRHCEVNDEIMHLHRRGVEVLTIYHAPDLDTFRDAQGTTARALRDYTRGQYERLSSRPAAFAFEANGFDPIDATTRVLNHQQPVARGPSLGIFREILELPAVL